METHPDPPAEGQIPRWIPGIPSAGSVAWRRKRRAAGGGRKLPPGTGEDRYWRGWPGKKRGQWARWGQLAIQALLEDVLLFFSVCVGWGGGVKVFLTDQFCSFIQAAPALLPARSFQLEVFGSRHLKSNTQVSGIRKQERALVTVLYIQPYTGSGYFGETWVALDSLGWLAGPKWQPSAL